MFEHDIYLSCSTKYNKKREENLVKKTIDIRLIECNTKPNQTKRQRQRQLEQTFETAAKTKTIHF